MNRKRKEEGEEVDRKHPVGKEKRNLKKEDKKIKW